MLTDKARAAMLFELAQELFINCCVARTLLEEARVANWRDSMGKTLDSEGATHLRGEFLALYEQGAPHSDQSAFRAFLDQVKVTAKIQ